MGLGVERRPVAITDRLPAGLTVAAVPTGTGWDCSAPHVGAATADCRYTVTPVAADTDLPPITLKVRVARGEHGTFTNVAIVSSDDNANSEKDSTATDTVVVPAPPASIKITKMAPTTPVRPGDPVRYAITVRNTGEVHLVNVRIHDSRATACDRNFAALEIAGVQTYTCERAAPAEDFTNTATATGTGPGGEVTDSSAATVTVVHPAVVITKETQADRVTRGRSGDVRADRHQHGDVRLRDIDAAYPGCSFRVTGILAPAERRTHTCTISAPADSFENKATATGTPTEGGPTR